MVSNKRALGRNKSQFCLWQNDRRVMVKRFRGKKHNMKFAVRGHVGVTPGVIIWSLIDIRYRSPLVFISSRLYAHRYIEEILRPVLLPLLNEYHGVVFQQDNARPHIAQISRNILQKAEVEVISWQARFADLNPIEHVWNTMGRRLGKFQPQANTLVELRRHVQQAWDEIPQEKIDHLIWGVPQQLRKCIVNRGNVTHYYIFCINFYCCFFKF